MSSAGRRSFSSKNHHSAAPAFTGKATHTVAYPLTGADPESFSFNRMLAANQKAWNAAHYPSTPVPATYAFITKATNLMMDGLWLLAYVAMGACMSTGIWAPVSSNTHHSTRPTDSNTT